MTATLPQRDLRTPFQRLADGSTAVPGTILHTDPTRGLTYLWHDRSQDPIDEGPRESGLETAALTVLNADGTCVAYLRISYTNQTIADATFGRLLEWAEENKGWCLGLLWPKRGGGETPSSQRLWCAAHNNARRTPASLVKAGQHVMPWNLTEDMAPESKVLEADLKAIERSLRPEYKRWLETCSVPFVAYSNTDTHVRGTGVGRQMYLLAAQHLATKGLVLRASGTQTADAQALWARLEADPQVPTTRTRALRYWTGKEQTTHLALDYR